MDSKFTIGSLFDGSGGFPLAAMLCGGTPLWASEIEPYPITVTKSRFPNMRHLGSVTDINGGEVEPVDVITFGSPCQDLSIAGKRAGLKHEASGDKETTRSGLFMEAVRIIREMREATNGRYPTFALWENVPGAFSSNKGEDFRTVLREIIQIVEPAADVPAVPKNGWPYADCYCGDGWSIGYRLFDAQYWGVPQRRRRIYLVADIRGERARKILFEREGLRGYFAEGGTPWKGASEDSGGSVGAADCEGAFGIDGYNSDVTGEVSSTLGVNCGMSTGRNGVCIPYPLKICSGSNGGGDGALIQSDKSATLSTLNDRYLFQPMSLREENWKESVVKNALRAGESKSSHVVVQPVNMVLDDQGGQQISVRTDGKSPTLRAEMHGNIPCVLESAGFCPEQSAKTRSVVYEDEIRCTLRAGVVPGVCIKCWDARGNGDGETVSTLTGDHENRVTDSSSLVVEESHAYNIQGNTIDRNAKQYGSGISEDVSHTLNTVDRHGVGYCMAHGQANAEICENKSPCLNCNHEQPIVAGVDCRNMNEYKELYPTLQAKPNGGQSLNFSGVVRIHFIVRRLTPTECARLQGFPDSWGHHDQKDDFSDEEYRFWLDVRNTHAAINGKDVKDYTKAQMLTWYNKLHSDSSEYKMWGNGIALPNALYVMQGIADCFCLSCD